MLCVKRDYVHRLLLYWLDLRKSPNFPPSCLTLFFSSLKKRSSEADRRVVFEPKGLLGAAFWPYRLPVEAPCQRFPDDGDGLLPLLDRRKGRAGSSPAMVCWGMLCPM